MNDLGRLLARPDAPRWRRVVARVLDLMTVFTVLWILSVLRVLWFMGDLSSTTAAGPWGRSLAPTVTFVVLAIAYEAVFLRYNRGQTPGKDVMGVRVIGRDGDPTLPRVTVRAMGANLVWLMPTPVVAIAVFTAVAVAFALHRRIAIHHPFGAMRVVPYDRSAEDPDAPPPPRFVRPSPHEPATEKEVVV